MKLSDITQKQGIEKSEQKPMASASSAPRRRYFWDEEENQKEASKEALKSQSTTVAIETHKVEPIISQTKDKHEPSLQPKLVQTSAKVEPKQSQRMAVKTKVEPQPEPNDKPKLVQTSAKVEPNIFFEELVGLQRNVLIHIFEMCVRTGSRTTPPVAISNLAIAMETTVSAGRKAIQRLEEKGFILRGTFKDGRGGWTKYELKEEVYKTLLLDNRVAKLEPNMGQSRAKVDTQLEPKPEPSPPCSSSNLSINNTTTTPGELEPDLWLSVPKNLEGRVSLKQLRDFVKQGLITPEDLQSSLDGFSYDLAKNAIKSKLGNPVAILIGAVKSGGYISQSYLSELKASMADVERSRLEMQQIQSSLELEQIQKEFESFRTEFPAEAEKFKPTSTYLTNFEPGSVGYKIWLEEYKKHQNMHHNEAANELAL